MDAQKKTLAAQERDASERQVFRELIATLDARQVVVVDESATHLGMIPTCGRAPRGQRRWTKKRRNYGKHMSLVATLTLNGMGPVMLLEGALDTLAFESYIQHCLLPVLHPGQVVVLDNLSIHTGTQVQRLIESHGCTVLFLPAYPTMPKQQCHLICHANYLIWNRAIG